MICIALAKFRFIEKEHSLNFKNSLKCTIKQILFKICVKY